MLKKAVLILLLCWVPCSFSQINHIGNWEGKSSTNEVIRITFTKDHNAKLYKSQSGIHADKIVPATYMTKYIIDYNKNPITLDFELIDSEGKKIYVIPVIATFLNDKEMEIGLGDKKRPEGFAQEQVKEIWYLEKVDL